MSEEPHAVVRLLLKRMESHPEEFKREKGVFIDRWEIYVNDIDDFGSTEDKAVMREAMRKFRMDEIHEAVMDELINGPERRRGEEEARNYAQQMQQMKQQRAANQVNVSSLANTYGSSLAGMQQDQNALLSQQSYGDARLAQQRSLVQSMNHTKDQYAKSILTSTPEPTWGTTQIHSIKKALGL